MRRFVHLPVGERLSVSCHLSRMLSLKLIRKSHHCAVGQSNKMPSLPTFANGWICSKSKLKMLAAKPIENCQWYKPLNLLLQIPIFSLCADVQNNRIPLSQTCVSGSKSNKNNLMTVAGTMSSSCPAETTI